MRALHFILLAQAVTKFVSRAASTLENATGEQRALGKFPLGFAGSNPSFTHFLHIVFIGVCQAV